MVSENNLENFQYQRRIYHSNTDSAGVVYYGDYFIFFEEARAEWLRSLGFEQSEFVSEFETHILVKSVHEMNFIRPAKMDDLITIKCKLLSSSKIAFTIKQAAYNESGDELVSAKIDLLCVDSNRGRPKKTPQILLDKLAGE